MALLAAMPACAEEPLPGWERALYKTLTYQAVSNVSDLVLFGTIIGGTPAAGAAFVAVSALSAMTLYYTYELAWNELGPPPEATSHETIAVKTVAYRVLTGTRNFGIGYAFSGGEVAAAAGFTLGQALADTGIYVANEYAWDAFKPRR